jgi:hypothetical protein
MINPVTLEEVPEIRKEMAMCPSVRYRFQFTSQNYAWNSMTALINISHQ